MILRSVKATHEAKLVRVVCVEDGMVSNAVCVCTPCVSRVGERCLQMAGVALIAVLCSLIHYNSLQTTQVLHTWKSLKLISDQILLCWIYGPGNHLSALRMLKNMQTILSKSVVNLPLSYNSPIKKLITFVFHISCWGDKSSDFRTFLQGSYLQQ